MKIQISNQSHQPTKRYSGVYQQQGRMITDADWNELVTIIKERQDAALEDVVGRFRPSEGLGIAVADLEEAADVPLELHHAVMGSALDHLVGEKPTSSACLPPSRNGASVVPADSRCASSRAARRPKSGAILRSRFSQDHEGLYKLPGDR